MATSLTYQRLFKDSLDNSLSCTMNGTSRLIILLDGDPLSDETTNYEDQIGTQFLVGLAYPAANVTIRLIVDIFVEKEFYDSQHIVEDITVNFGQVVSNIADLVLTGGISPPPQATTPTPVTGAVNTKTSLNKLVWVNP
jgi:hypothetical protein